MSAIELAWAAGLFEGEGCLSASVNQPHHPIITVTSTDHDVLERFRRAVGVGTIRSKEVEPHWKPAWVWTATGSAAATIMREFAPHFCSRRAARAAELLAVRDAHITAVTAERECAGCGQMFRPRFTSKSRQTQTCSIACRAEAKRKYMRTYARGAA